MSMAILSFALLGLCGILLITGIAVLIVMMSLRKKGERDHDGL